MSPTTPLLLRWWLDFISVRIPHGLDPNKKETALPVGDLGVFDSVFAFRNIFFLAKVRYPALWDHLVKLLLGGYENDIDRRSDQIKKDTVSCVLDVSACHLLNSCFTDLKHPTTFYIQQS